MKKNFTKKLCLALVCVFLLTQLLSLGVFAGLPAAYFDVDPNCIQWGLTAEERTLTASDGRVLTLVEFSNTVYTDAKSMYCYANGVGTAYDAYYNSLCSYAKDGEIVWFYNGYGDSVYATEAGKEMLLAFDSGEDASYRIEAYPGYGYELEKDTLDTLNAAAKANNSGIVIDVKELKDAERYNVTAHDSTCSIAYEVGAVYVISGSYFYINYLELDNSHFDADGKFSYRKGEVTLTLLDDALTNEVKTCIDRITTYQTSTEYENEPDWETYEPTEFPLAIFWLFYALVGFIIPLPLLALGIILPNIKKLGRPKYWYILAALAALWIALALFLMIILLV